MQTEKFYRMLGLAARAGKVVHGEGGAVDSIRNKKAKLRLAQGMIYADQSSRLSAFGATVRAKPVTRAADIQMVKRPLEKSSLRP